MASTPDEWVLVFWRQPKLNAFMALGRPAWRAVRGQLQSLLSADNATLRDDAAAREEVFFPLDKVRCH